MSRPSYEDLARQLSKGLDLCVRARRLDAQDRTNIMTETFPGIDMTRAAPRLNAVFPDTPYETRSATIPVWIQQQYDTDLTAWEADTQRMLSMLPLHAFTNPTSEDG